MGFITARAALSPGSQSGTIITVSVAPLATQDGLSTSNSNYSAPVSSSGVSGDLFGAPASVRGPEDLSRGPSVLSFSFVSDG